MKKLLILMMFSFALSVGVNAQTKETEVKVKKTSTPIQKVHNAVHRKKHYKGYKVKRKYSNGLKTKKIVNNRTGEVKVKQN